MLQVKPYSLNAVIIIMRGIWVILLFPMMLVGQVSYLSGSYNVATASGSGAGGVPSLSYTPTSGTDRVLIFFMIVERDHAPGATGDNWASNAPTGGSVPTVEISTTTLSHLSSQWLYEYDAVDTESDADMSLELMIYGTLEANIPAGTNTFNITANFNDPSNTGDDAIFGALMFENVAGMSNITNASCNNCNTISSSSVSPNDGNNAVFSIGAASGDRTITAGANQTIVSASSSSNSNGTYTGYSEQDGLAGAAQYRTVTALSSTSPFTASGAADMFGMLESVFRITATTALPVDLVSFTAEHLEGETYLNWTTGAEINNDRFEVERSTDGLDWEKIGVEYGAGNSVEMIDYKFIDDFAPGGKTFYRLKQIDFDGTFAYSKVVIVSSENINSEIFIYQKGSEVDFVSNQEIVAVSIYDMNGRIISSKESLFNKNHTVQFENQPPGIYVARFMFEKTIINKSFLIK